MDFLYRRYMSKLFYIHSVCIESYPLKISVVQPWTKINGLECLQMELKWCVEDNIELWSSSGLLCTWGAEDLFKH